MYLPLQKPTKFQFTPSQVLVLGFAVLILAGALLLWLPGAQEPGQKITFIDALFTATSAVCVTGLVVVDTATQFSFGGELVVLGLIQAGGLGIMTLSALMFLLMGKRISLRERLLMQEALGSFSIAGVVRLTRNIIFATFAIEATGALLLTLYFSMEYPLKKAAYWGIFHAVSAFNNAGFDVTSVNLKMFARDPFILGVIGHLIILGGTGFIVIEDFWKNRQWEKLTLHSRVVIKMTALLLGVGTLLFLLLEWGNPQTFGSLPWYHKIANAWFAAVTPRTAGFESVYTGAFRDVTLLFTIILMFIGASPGGTGGGVKTTTFTMMTLTARAVVTGKEELTVMGRRLPKDLAAKAFTITGIALTLVIGVTGLMLVTEGVALADPKTGITAIRILFEVVSAFGTVGLTAGVTPALTVAGKLLITLMMFVGRVGPLTLVVALAKRRFDRSPIHYPEDRVMIG